MANLVRILFGGTFAPPHLGHEAMVKEALHLFPDAMLHVIPAVTPPSRDGEKKEVTTAFYHRLAMCKLAFTFNPMIQVDDESQTAPSVSYTIEMVSRYHSIHPTDHLLLLMGQDQLVNFPNWRLPLDILDLTDLIVAVRGEQSLDTAILRTFTELGLKFKKENQRYAFQRKNGSAGYIYLLQMPPHAAKSQELRLSLNSTDLKPNVLAYIEKNQLYCGD